MVFTETKFKKWSMTFLWRPWVYYSWDFRLLYWRRSLSIHLKTIWKLDNNKNIPTQYTPSRTILMMSSIASIVILNDTPVYCTLVQLYWSQKQTIRLFKNTSSSPLFLNSMNPINNIYLTYYFWKDSVYYIILLLSHSHCLFVAPLNQTIN